MITLSVANSGNRKLGPGWSVTYRPVGPTCPADCPLLGAGCYAQRHLVSIASKRSGRKRNSTSDEVRTLDGAGRVRWDVSGDGLKSGSLDHDYLDAKESWHHRNQGSISLGYTHAPSAYEDAGRGPGTWPDGFNLLASCHSPTEATALRSRGWRTARVAEAPDEPLSDCERLCPYDAAKAAKRAPSVSCATCGLCFRPQHQDKSIVFVKF